MNDPFISEVRYFAPGNEDFIEITVDQGADVSSLIVTVYNGDGTVRSTRPIDGLTPTTSGGLDRYVVGTGVGRTNAVALSDDTELYSFISFDIDGVSVAATEGAAINTGSVDVGSTGRNESLASVDGNVYFVQSPPSPGLAPCFTSGVQISTEQGLVRIDDLQVGAQVAMVGGGFRPLLISIRREVSADELREYPQLYPIRITAGALGQGLPKRDLLVSRQHRMLVSSPVTQRMFGEASVLVAAIKLTVMPGIYIDTLVDSVEYFHLVFDEHLVLFAEGAPSESLYVGHKVLSDLSSAARDELLLLFPELRQPVGALKMALLVPENAQQKKLLYRHAKNNMDILRSFKG